MKKLKELDSEISSAPRGSKSCLLLKVATRPDGTAINIPVIIIKGLNAGPRCLLDACHHGDEYEATLAIVELGMMLDPKDITGTFVGVPVLNVPAFEGMNRINPLLLEESPLKDINRIYPGKLDRSLTEKIAHVYFNKIVLKSQYVISFHGGGNKKYWIPRIHVISPETRELAKAMGEGWFIQEKGLASYTDTLVHVCSQKAIRCIIAEIGGGGGRWPTIFRSNIEVIKKSVVNVMKHYGMLAGKPQFPESWDVIEGFNIYASMGGLFRLEPNLRPGESVEKGVVLARVIDYFGREVEKICAPCDGIVMGSKTDLCVYPGDLLLKVGRVLEKDTEYPRQRE